MANVLSRANVDKFVENELKGITLSQALVLHSKLIDPMKVAPRAGLPTGTALDGFVSWKGIPQKSVSLFYGPRGLGATSTWLQAATQVTKDQKWVAWVEEFATKQCPTLAHQQGADLSRFFVVRAPKDRTQLLWVLNELMSVNLFETIGCSLGVHQLTAGQVLKLSRSAQKSHAALVIISHQEKIWMNSFYALVAKFAANKIIVQRALHRPTPMTIERRNTNADTVSQLASLNQIFHRGELSRIQPTSLLP